MRIALTGATSFIGRQLLAELTARGHECIPIVRKGKKRLLHEPYNSVSHVVEMDMEDYTFLAKETGRVDCLVCLSWNGTRGDTRMDYYLQKKNYECTMNAIVSVVSRGCKLVITAGSQAEYGNVNGKISERTKLKPNTEYGIWKKELFEQASVYCNRYEAKVIEPRFFSLYGPGDTEKTMIIDIISKMLKDEVCDLTYAVQMWDFLFLKDAVEALVLLLENDVPGGAYNFGSGDCRQLKDFVEEMKIILQSKSLLNYGVIPYPVTGMVSIHPDITKLTDTINWKARTSFHDGILAVARSLDVKNEED